MDTNIKYTNEIFYNIAKLERLIGKWEVREEDGSLFLDILENKALVSSISSSLRIEGIDVKDYEVEKVINGINLNYLKDETIKAILGYLNALNYIKSECSFISFNEELIKKLSYFVTGSDIFRESEPIQNILKNEPNIENAPSLKIKELLNQLIDQAQVLERVGNIHPVLISGFVINSFLRINPFESGNGRISRLLSYYFLLKYGYSLAKYLSFESIIEETRNIYLTSIKRGQETLDESYFISYYVKVLIKSATKLINSTEKEKERYISKERNDLSPLEIKIIEIINHSGPSYTYDIFTSLDEVKLPTLKKALSSMVSKGLIIRKGKGRGTYYYIEQN